MKTILISIALLCCISFSSLSQEQKVTVKKEQVSLNDTPVFKMVSTTYPDAYTIYNLNDEKLIYFNAYFYNSAKQITPGNPEGRIGHF